MASDQQQNAELAAPGSIARLDYFYGQLLAQRDLKSEQAYHLVLRRLLQREAFGTGTVAGLKVEAAGSTSDRAAYVRAGLAIDPEGREILLETDACVTIAELAHTPVANGSTDGTDIAADLRAYWGRSISPDDVVELQKDLVRAGLTEAAPEADSGKLVPLLNGISSPAPAQLAPGQTLRDFLFDALVATTYVGARYLERGADPAPGMLDGGCCDAGACHPTRRQQGATIVMQSGAFASIVDPHGAALDALSACVAIEENPATGSPTLPFSHECRSCLADFLLGSWRPVSGADACTTGGLPAVPLARVRWARYPRATGDQSRILSIDNELRPLAPGGATMHALFEAITQCAPAIAVAPHFDAMSPANGAQVTLSGNPDDLVLWARATCRLAPLSATSWELLHYPPGAALPQAWPGSSSPFGVALELEADGERSRVQLRLTKAAGDTSLVLPAGTYVWRLNTDGTVKALATSALLDGEPAPITAVPSGNGKPGGEFEARFYVA